MVRSINSDDLELVYKIRSQVLPCLSGLGEAWHENNSWSVANLLAGKHQFLLIQIDFVRFATHPKHFELIAATIEAWLLRRRPQQLSVPLWWMSGSFAVYNTPLFRRVHDRRPSLWRSPIEAKFRCTFFMTNEVPRSLHLASPKQLEYLQF